MKYLNLDVIPISGNITKTNVLTIHTKEKEKLKQTLAAIPNRICLTSNL